MTPLPRIPVANLPEPKRDTITRVGHVYAHKTYIPIIYENGPDGEIVYRNQGHENLGDELADISSRLSQEQVESLCDLKEIKVVTIK